MKAWFEKQRNIIDITILLCCLWLWSASTAYAVDGQELLEPDAAFELTHAVKNAQKLKFSWSIAEGYYLYRHQFKFASQTAGIEVGTPLFPKGEAKQDKFHGSVEIYRRIVTVELPLSRPGCQGKACCH